jgi:hypothetical protein
MLRKEIRQTDYRELQNDLGFNSPFFTWKIANYLAIQT